MVVTDTVVVVRTETYYSAVVVAGALHNSLSLVAVAVVVAAGASHNNLSLVVPAVVAAVVVVVAAVVGVSLLLF